MPKMKKQNQTGELIFSLNRNDTQKCTVSLLIIYSIIFHKIISFSLIFQDILFNMFPSYSSHLYSYCFAVWANLCSGFLQLTLSGVDSYNLYFFLIIFSLLSIVIVFLFNAFYSIKVFYCSINTVQSTCIPFVCVWFSVICVFFFF